MDHSKTKSTETDPGKRKLTRRRWFGGVLMGAAGVGYYGCRIEPYWVAVVHREMPISNLPAHLEGKTLVQISDIHIGRYVDDKFLIRWFQEVATWEPDFVVFTGDFLTIQSDGTLPIEQMKKVLAHFPQGKSATIGILGNHDYGLGWKSIKDANVVTVLASDFGLDILRNKSKTFDGLQVIGFDDYWSPRFGGMTVFKSVDISRPSLVLCHNPDAVDLLIWYDYRGWILSGHTHGGQCKLPFFTPPRLPIRNKRYSAIDSMNFRLTVPCSARNAGGSTPDRPAMRIRQDPHGPHVEPKHYVGYFSLILPLCRLERDLLAHNLF